MDKLKSAAIINDLSGSSRCSLTTAIPVITAMGIQCCALPTAILSNHTGYPSYFFDDYTDNMQSFADKWEEQNLKFDCIYSGFLGSDRQIELVTDFISRFRSENTKVIVDPVMGDNGKIYPTYTQKMCIEMKNLISCADVITPNVTEACVLSNSTYCGEDIDEREACSIAKKIAALGAGGIVITGIKSKGFVSNYVYSEGNGKIFTTAMVPKCFTGTGDLFSAVLSGRIINGSSVFDAAKFAAEFVHLSAEYSYQIGMSENEGVCFEKFISRLI